MPVSIPPKAVTSLKKNINNFVFYSLHRKTFVTITIQWNFPILVQQNTNIPLKYYKYSFIPSPIKGNAKQSEK
jgi:MFS-type transporter involved in bile tolerance (Atg22 family)